MTGLKVQVDAHVVRVKGELDADTAPTLQAELAETVGEGWDQIVIDLRDVPFVDSSGLGALVTLRKRALEQGSEVVLRAPHDRVRMLLDVTGLAGKVFAVTD